MNYSGKFGEVHHALNSFSMVDDRERANGSVG